MAIDPNLLEQLIAAIISIVSILIAIFKAQDEKAAIAQTAAVNAFFDPADETVVVPPEGIPARSYLMTDETKRWITYAESPEDSALILNQIAAAEVNKLVSYRIKYGKGYYDVEYGLIKGSGRDIK